MPTPEPGETRDDFLERCIPELVDEGNEQDQAVAICSSMYEEAKESAARFGRIRRYLAKLSR